MKSKVTEFKKNCAKSGIKLIKEALSDGKKYIVLREQIADGSALYRLDSNGFYIGGAYATFAGDNVEDIYVSEYNSSYVSTVGLKKKTTLGNIQYELHYTWEQFEQYADFNIVMKFLDALG